MAQKAMPIDKVEGTTKTVERVEVSTQKALLLLYFSCRLRFFMQDTTLGCLGIYSVGGEVGALIDDAIMPTGYGGLKTGRRR